MAKNPDRVILAQCVGKLMAYLRVDKKEEAKEWAVKLQAHLKKMKLLP